MCGQGLGLELNNQTSWPGENILGEEFVDTIVKSITMGKYLNIFIPLILNACLSLNI